MSEKPKLFGVCLHCGAFYDECRCPDRLRRARVNRLERKSTLPGRARCLKKIKNGERIALECSSVNTKGAEHEI